MVDPDAPEPPRRTYGLKRRETEPAESPAPPPQVLSAGEMAKLAGDHHDPKVPAPAAPRGDDPNDVVSVRQQLRNRERADGRDRIEIKERKSRRKRDYWILMTASNLLFGTILVIGWGNIVMMIYAFSAMVLLSMGFTWVMWFIMSDY
ncbi:MAG TPA: hypothetical protein VEB66_17820 [Opitutaceae bacterium]|nr:hypothetical protein [Opitutaceae bacterium]